MSANANVTVDSTVWSDIRYDVLAKHIGCDRFAAIGRMIMLWSDCTDRETDQPPLFVIDGCLGNGGAEALISSGLGERVEDGLVRVKGCENRIYWLAAKRRGGKESAKRRAAAKLQLSCSSVEQELKTDTSETNTCSTPVQQVFNTPATSGLRSQVLIKKEELPAGKPPAPPKPKKPSGDHQQALAVWFELFAEHNQGAKPTVDGAAGKNLKRLLAAHGHDEVCRRMQNAFAGPPWPYEPPRTFLAFAKNFDGYAILHPKPEPKRPLPASEIQRREVLDPLAMQESWEAAQ